MRSGSAIRHHHHLVVCPSVCLSIYLSIYLSIGPLLFCGENRRPIAVLASEFDYSLFFFLPGVYFII